MQASYLVDPSEKDRGKEFREMEIQRHMRMHRERVKKMYADGRPGGGLKGGGRKEE